MSEAKRQIAEWTRMQSELEAKKRELATMRRRNEFLEKALEDAVLQVERATQTIIEVIRQGQAASSSQSSSSSSS